METYEWLNRDPRIALLLALAFLGGGIYLLSVGALPLGGFALFASGMNCSRALCKMSKR